MLRKTIQTRMNLEIVVTEEMLDFACQLQPNSCCIVPERRKEITTEYGLDVNTYKKSKLSKFLIQLNQFDIKSSLFVNADENQISAEIDIGASCIKIHTGIFALCIDNNQRGLEFERIKYGIHYCALQHGLEVHAGYGLDYDRVISIASLPLIKELNIGHVIISRAIFL